MAPEDAVTESRDFADVDFCLWLEQTHHDTGSTSRGAGGAAGGQCTAPTGNTLQASLWWDMAPSGTAEDEGVSEARDRLLESWTQLKPPVPVLVGRDAQQREG